MVRKAMYEFKEQLSKGEAAELVLDRHYAQFFDIHNATRDDQRRGIDRFFTRADSKSWPVEYKADWTASQTGNAFVETVSVDSTNKRGWAYTSQAEWLLYFLPRDALVYVIQMKRLRDKLGEWERLCQKRRIENRGYSTHGLLVPLAFFEELAQRVDTL